MSDKERFFLIMHNAFLNIRIHAAEKECEKVFAISGFLCGFPSYGLKMLRETGDIDFKTLLEHIENEAEARNMERWFNYAANENSPSELDSK